MSEQGWRRSHAFTGFALTFALAALLAAAPAGAAVTCPNPIPVVQEQACSGAGSSGWLLTNASENLGGFSTKTSFALGESVPLKIARNVPTFPATRVDIAVYRTGYYGGSGGRLIPGAGATGVTVNNDYTCRPRDATTGKLDCGNWNVTYTIPGASLPATGVYVAKLTATDTGIQNSITFIVRDDARVPASKILVVEPTNTWVAYNVWGGKSLYFDKDGGASTVAGTDRAVKVSFNRPLWNPNSYRDRYQGPDYQMVAWLERQGYDVSYTTDDQVAADPAELRRHSTVVFTGHSEYWTLEEFNAVKAARDAGVNIASFSANTAYWKVRLEESGRTLVCYKTVEGSGSSGNGQVSANDWGPDGALGTADDALGADGRAGTADDRPENSTTTFRDNGAAPGDPNAPTAGRVGPDMPENQLFGVMYVGDADSNVYPLTVPGTNGAGEYAGDRIWRNTGLSTTSSTNLGTNYVGWEWDAVPTQAQYTSRQPAGVKRLSSTTTTSGTPSWLLDEGRARATTPPPGQPGTVNAVKYTAPSGALVFAGGTNMWAQALSGTPDARVAQATYNIFSDMGVQPNTPAGVTVDPADGPPRAVVSATPTSGPTPLAVSFDGRGSSDNQGPIAGYEWDLDGDGSYDDGTGSTASFTYTSLGTYTARLRVTDSANQTDVATTTITAGSPPTASIATPAASLTWSVGNTVNFSGSAVDGDGDAIPASGLSWALVLETCGASGGACSEQQLQTFGGVATGSFTAPNAAYPANLRLRLTATDANGLKSTVERRIDPKTVALTMDATTPGLQVKLGAETAAAPFTRTVIAGSANTIDAPSPQNLGVNTYLYGGWSDGGAQTHAITAPATNTTYRASYTLSAVGTTLVGTESVLPTADANGAGEAEAFKTTAGASGTVGFLFVYLDAAATASELVTGLYSDSANKPGTLLTTGRLTNPQPGVWNKVTVPAVSVTAGTSYWIAVLGPAGTSGLVRFRMTAGGGRAETSASKALTGLPTAWSTGTVYTDGPVSAYGAALGAAQSPELTVSPASLSFSATAGGANPAAKTLSITNTGGGALNYTASDDAPWLTVSPPSGSAPQTLSATADISGLAAGTYTATITVTSAGAGGSPKTIPVTLTVDAPQPPALSVSPASLSFSATAGGGSPGAKTVSITNTGGGSLNYTASDDAPWLTATPASGSAPQTLTVTPDVTGLAAGTYTATVTVTAAGATGSPRTIPITFTVDAPQPPVLSVSPSSLSFTATAGAANPAAKSLSITNTGSGTLNYTASDDAPWLTATPASGSAPQSVSANVDITGLAAGTHTATITVTAAGANGSPQTIPVTLTVNAPQPPALSLTPTSLTFAGTAGAANPAAKTVSIANTGGGTLNYTASDDAPWLTATPASGSAPQTLSVTAALSGLAAGTYNATITVTAAGATGSPQTIPVTLTVAAAPPPNVGLVAAYGFEEASGTGVLDASGTGNNGTLTGATRITTGKNGRALSFTANGNMVTVPDSPSLRLVRNMTLEAWVYPTSLGTAWRTVLLKERTGDLAYGLYANTNLTRPAGFIWTTREIEARGTAALAVNAWSHLAATYDGTNFRLYVNGAQVSSVAATGNLVSSTLPLRLGGNAIWGEYFAGRLDDVRVYSRTLTATELQADMNAGVPAGP